MLTKHHLRLRGGGNNGDERNEAEAEKRRRKRHCYNYTVKQKIAIVQEAYSKPNYVRKFARKEGMTRSHDIRKWKKMLDKLKAKALVNPHAKTCGKGPTIKDFEFEQELKFWILQQRDQDIPVQTRDIIHCAIQMQPDFRGGNQK
jgi:hypothetical protein